MKNTLIPIICLSLFGGVMVCPASAATSPKKDFYASVQPLPSPTPQRVNRKSFSSKPQVAVKSNSSIKAELNREILGLQADLQSASNTIVQLHQDKNIIQQSLDDMAVWGKEQQAQADRYYSAAVKSQNEVVAAKQREQRTIEKYHRLKLLASMIAGLLAMVFYLYKDQSSSGIIGLAAGLSPYAGIVKIAAPILVFVAGFFCIWLPF